MDHEDKASALTEITKVRLEKYKQTCDLQYKANIALWTQIVLVGHKGEQTLALSGWSDNLFYALIVVAVVLCHHLLWLILLSESMARDIAMAFGIQKPGDKEVSVTVLKKIRTTKPEDF